MGSDCSKAQKDKENGNCINQKKTKKVYLRNSDGEGLSSLSLRGVPTVRPMLDEETLEVLVSSWKIIKRDMEHVGVVMFMGLLEEDEVKNTFRAFRFASKEELQTSAALRSHVLRVMGVVDKLIARIDEPDKAIALLHELGQNHVRYDAKAEYLDLVGPQFNLAIRPALGDKWTPVVEQAWADMFRFMTHVMKETMIM